MKYLALTLAILIPAQAGAFGLDLPRLTFPGPAGPGVERVCPAPAAPAAPDCPAP